MHVHNYALIDVKIDFLCLTNFMSKYGEDVRACSVTCAYNVNSFSCSSTISSISTRISLIFPYDTNCGGYSWRFPERGSEIPPWYLYKVDTEMHERSSTKYKCTHAFP